MYNAAPVLLSFLFNLIFIRTVLCGGRPPQFSIQKTKVWANVKIGVKNHMTWPCLSIEVINPRLNSVFHFLVSTSQKEMQDMQWCKIKTISLK